MASVIDILLKAKDKASKEIDKVTDSLEEMGEATTSGAENTEAFNMGIGDLAKKAATVAGVVAGVGAVIKQGFEFAKEGAELDAARDKFDRLAASIGTTGDALLGDLKDATRGMFSDAQLVAQATDMMSLGLAKTEEQAIRLASSSAALNMNMNALTLTLTNKTTARFDTLGVAVDGFDERVQALVDTGMSADDAFGEAFLQQAEAQIEKVGEAADSSIGAFNRLESSFANITDQAKKDLIPVFENIADGLASDLERAEEYNDALENLTDSQISLYNEMTVARDGVLTMEGVVRTVNEEMAFANSVTDGWSASLFALSENTGTVTEVSSELVSEFGGLLSITESVSREMENFNNKQDDLIGKSADVQSQIEDLVDQGYSREGEVIQDLQNKLDDYNEKLDDNVEKFEDNIDRRILKRAEEILSADDLTLEEEKALLKMGNDMGIYTDEYVAEAQRIIDQSQEIADVINGLPTQKTFTYFMQTSGSIPENINLHVAGERAAGGPVSAGKPYLVGERGPEIFAPSQGGSIIPNNKIGGAGGSFTLVVSPQVMLGTQEEIENVMMPIVEKGVRQMQSDQLL